MASVSCSARLRTGHSNATCLPGQRPRQPYAVIHTLWQPQRKGKCLKIRVASGCQLFDREVMEKWNSVSLVGLREIIMWLIITAVTLSKCGLIEANTAPGSGTGIVLSAFTHTPTHEISIMILILQIGKLRHRSCSLMYVAELLFTPSQSCFRV